MTVYVRARTSDRSRENRGREIGLWCDDCDSEFVVHFPDAERAQEPSIGDLYIDAQRHLLMCGYDSSQGPLRSPSANTSDEPTSPLPDPKGQEPA